MTAVRSTGALFAPARAALGVATAWFAVACPVCNKIVLILLAGAVVYRWRARPCADASCGAGSCGVGSYEVSGSPRGGLSTSPAPSPSASASAGRPGGTTGY